MDRKKFLRNTAIGSLAMTGCNLAVSSKNEPVNGIVHHVFFWLKNPQSEEDKNKVIAGIRTFKDIPSVKGLRVGIPAGTEQRDVVDHSYQVSELLFFDDLAGQKIYQDHPIHQKFVDECSPLFERVVVYDFIDV